jgi:hypothetical protein
MTNRFLILSCVFSAAFLLLKPAQAQNCSFIYEESSKMRKPEFASYNVWSTERGEVENQEIYRSATLGPQGAIILAGERQGERIKNKELILAQLGNRGRISWEKFYPVEGLENAVKILPHKNGFMVLANVQTGKSRDEIWIGFFDALGKLTDQKTIANKTAGLEAFDIIADPKGRGFILAATIAKNDEAHPVSSVLYRLDMSGKVLSDTAFILGSENRILGLSSDGIGGFIATGFSQGTDGRKNGWIMRLDDSLGIVWQQAYPRGAGASLTKGMMMLKNNIAVVGTSSPAVKEGLRAGWVMVVDFATGTPIWQRFYSSDVHYAGRDITISKDGVISVVMDGDAEKKSQEQDYAQLITLDPRGFVMASDVFYNGEGVDVHSMIEGPAHERILIGKTQVAHQIPKLSPKDPAKDPGQKIPEDEKFDVKRSQQGWVLAATAVDPYKDPCVQSFTTLP